MTMNTAAGIQRPATARVLKEALFIGVIIYACSIFGIYTAPPGVLAAFWPANAVLLGLLVRRDHPPGLAHWLAAAAGYMLASLYMDHGWAKSAMLTCTNMLGVAVGHILLAGMDEAHQGLRHPRSMMRFLLVVVSASAAAGVSGIFINPVLFGGSHAYGFAFWFCTELASYIAILPVMLTLPDARRWLREHRRRADWPQWRLEYMAPLAAFAGSLWLGTQLGGPGAIAYPVPAMLWCALSYSLFATAGITLLFSMWTLLAIASGTLVLGASVDTQQAIMSVRVGVTLTALAPLTVASVMVARNELLERLKYAASHDHLTQVLNRSGFMLRADGLLATPHLLRRPVAVLMMDIDHFKKVNDAHGHAAGDLVLKEFAKIAQGCLRGGDQLGRLGGEEFAVLLPGCVPDDARLIAQRICDAFARHGMQVGEGQLLNCTVSIGVYSEPQMSTPIETMLSAADAALYRAKESGRNRVMLA